MKQMFSSALRFARQEISENFVWLRPVCELFPSKVRDARISTSWPQVPSSFFLGDSFLMLDKKFRGGLIVVDERLAKKDIAAREARRVKKLMGALRHLFRNSAWDLRPCLS